ncbi:alpha/beta fold hydrolase [Bowmanella sp. Y26]|uniref:alpha/beta hydrolase n=1 Tax=Bowmanella yangjiangensis TaxID=2811230 RepID=UPI001BDDC22E|nr:alpha/beta fold hydrolase [Bowmanella yangjiangensis]MBT1063733.1 alpha/beta fold hydrolase [Bowmanella yangjiangensis]
MRFSLRLLLGLIPLVLGSTSGALALSRSPLLGIAPASSSQDLVTIGSIAPNSTAAALGLLPEDKLLSLNNVSITHFDQLLTLLSTMNSGDPLTLQIRRNNKSLTLQGQLLPKPYEVSEVAYVSYEEVKFNGHRLRSIVHTPKTLKPGEKAPAIFYLQGYTCGSIDMGLFPNSTLTQLVQQFSEAGFIVYRVEKPGVGDSQSPQHCSEINFTAESDAFIQALRELKGRENVNANKVYLWGHSLGVLHSVNIANQEKVAGIIGYGGVFKPWYDYLLDIYRHQSVRHFSVPPKQAESNTRLVQPFLDLWLNSNTPWSEVLLAEDAQAALETDLLPVQNEQVFSRHFSFFRDMNRYDFATLWRQVATPVLMLHGSLDIQAIDSQWAFDIVKASSSPQSTAQVIDGAEHALLRYQSAQQYGAAREQGEFNPMDASKHFDPRIGEETLDWIQSLRWKPLLPVI